MAQLIIDKQYVDFFDDEHVVLTSSIKKVENLEAVFTEYTKEFTVPATQNNVTIFNHYDVIGLKLPPQANPHISIPATLVISDGDELEGRVEMRGVTWKEGNAYTFLIAFYGNLISVRSQLEGRMMNSCRGIDNSSGVEWDNKFNTSYTYTDIKDGWAHNEPSVFIPVVDNTQNYAYVTEEVPTEDGFLRNNIAPHDGSPATPDVWGGIRWEHLRPAFNLKEIIVDIFEKNVVNKSGNPVSLTYHHKISTHLDNAYIMPNAGQGFPVNYSGISAGFKVGLDPTLPDGTTIPKNWATIPLPDEIYDEGNHYDPATSSYTVQAQGVHSFRVKLYAETGAIFHRNVVVHIIVKDSAGTVISSVESMWGSSEGGSDARKFEGSHVMNIWADAGHTITIEWRRIQVGVAFTVVCYKLDWTLINYPVILSSRPIKACNFMPEMNAYEFVSNFLKTFNCLLITDKDQNFKVIDTQSYYASGGILKWSGNNTAFSSDFILDSLYKDSSLEFEVRESVTLFKVDGTRFDTYISGINYALNHTILTVNPVPPTTDFITLVAGSIKDYTSFVDIIDISSRKLDIPKRVYLEWAENEVEEYISWYNAADLDYGEVKIINTTDFSNEYQRIESIFAINHPAALELLKGNINSSPGYLNATYTDLYIPRQVNEDGEPIEVDFLLFYNSGEKSCIPYRFQKSVDINGNVVFGEEATMPLVQNFFYNPPVTSANLRTLSYDTIDTYPIEDDLYARKTTYTEFFEDWYQWMADRNTRRLTFKGTIPPHEYTSLKLNDNLHIDGGHYIISKLQYDWLDNSISMSLLTYDDTYTTSKIIDIDKDGKVTVAVCAGQVCRRDTSAVSASYLQTRNLAINTADDIMWLGKASPFFPNRNLPSGGGSGEGYHKYILDIPTPVTPIAIGDVMAFYTKNWRKADSSREERTAQGVVVKVEGSKYTMIRFGDVIVPAHGYDLNTWYWLAPDGTYVKDKPFKLAQLLFYVYDADLLQFNIEQPITQIEEKLGWIHLGEHPAVGWTFTPTHLNTFEELKIDIPHFEPANTRSFTLDAATNRVKLDFPVRPEEPVFVQITIMVALSLESGSTRNVEIVHGVDGTVASQTDWYNQHYGTNLPALGVYVPMTYHWSGQVKNEHMISIFIRTDTTEQIIGFAKSIQVTGQI